MSKLMKQQRNGWISYRIYRIFCWKFRSILKKYIRNRLILPTSICSIWPKNKMKVSWLNISNWLWLYLWSLLIKSILFSLLWCFKNPHKKYLSKLSKIHCSLISLRRANTDPTCLKGWWSSLTNKSKKWRKR